MSESTAPLDTADGADPAPLPDNQTEPGSLRERLEASYDAIEAREADEKGVSSEVPGNAERKPSPEQSAALRDPTGKFAPKSPAEQPAAAPEKSAPPAWLTGKAAVDWNRLPPTVREALASAVPPPAVDAAPPPPPQQSPPDPIRQVAERYSNHFTSRGVPLEQGVAALFQTYEAMEQNPEAMLRHLAGQYGVPWGGQPSQQPPEGQPVGQSPEWMERQLEAHPAVAALRAELAELKQGYGSIQQQQQAQLREAQARKVHEASTAIDRFANDPANPRPHFDAVREDMAILMRSGRAADLAEAYDRAVWSNPQVRATLLAEQQAQAAEQAAKAAREREQAARRAALINARTVGTSGVASTNRGSIRDTMERVAAGLE